MVQFTLMSKAGLKDLIIGIVAIFMGFILIIVLATQASLINSATGSVTLRSEGLPIFYGAIILAMFSVLLGGFEIGRYVEMEMGKRNKVNKS